jgi:uncharacterized protein YqeY
MSNLLENVKNLRLEAFKARKKEERFAYESVITEVQTQQGRGVEITDGSVIGIIKKEISRYTEMNRPLEVQILSDLLPKQLTTEQLKEKFLELSKDEVLNPKTFMSKLDSNGYEGCYNKGIAAQIVLGKV